MKGGVLKLEEEKLEIMEKYTNEPFRRGISNAMEIQNAMGILNLHVLEHGLDSSVSCLMGLKQALN